VLSLLPAHLSSFPNPLYFSGPLLELHSSGNTLTSILTLTSLFTLITKHSLACPPYYPRLHSLITPATFNSPHLGKFLPLLTLSLKTTHMPTYMYRAFAKRLLRTALAASPSSALFLAKYASNLLRDPRCAPLVHRNDGGDFEDEYDWTAGSLDGANANATMAWEIHALRKHYYAPVADVAHKIGKEKGEVLYDLGDVGREGVADLFARESGKERGGELGVAFDEVEDELWY
jgi:hypothetical protein